MEVPLLSELKQRRVVRALLAYGIAAFALLQIVEPIMHGLHWPEAVLSYVVVAIASGFPIVVAIAWAFDVGESRARRVPLIALIGAAAAAPGLIYFFAVRRPAAALPSSVAVLPFVNMSSDKETDYFSDGITEELIDALANVEGLRVSSRTAVFALRGKDMGVQEIGERLQVGTLLEGSVRREGNALRITAQLIKVSDGYHLWSKTYDREANGVFAIEDEITRSIASSLRRTLVGVKPQTESVEAHDLYLKGRFFWNRRTVEALRRSAGLFEQAARADPGYALAWSGRADALALLHDARAAGDEVLPQAVALARRALEIDPDLAEGHASMGLIAMQQRNYALATKELHRAIDLNPGYVMAHKWLGDVLSYTGRNPEARDSYQRALDLDPASLITRTNLAITFIDLRDDARAERELSATLEMDPSFSPAHFALAYLDSLRGKVPECFAEAEKWSAPQENRRLLCAYALAVAGRRKEAVAIVDALDPSTLEASAFEVAAVWVALGDRERAFGLMKRHCERFNPWALAWDPLRPDPRFEELRRCAKAN